MVIRALMTYLNHKEYLSKFYIVLITSYLNFFILSGRMYYVCLVVCVFVITVFTVFPVVD
jgi:hypothetical protein